MSKRKRQEEDKDSSKSVRVTLHNISPQTRDEITQAIETAMYKESLRSSAAIPHTSPTSPLTMVFSDIACIDRRGTDIVAPRNVQSAYQWEAWRVPLYDLGTASSSAASSASSSTPPGTPSSSTKMTQAPPDHISRQARGRYHLSCNPTDPNTVPGGPLSQELREALGLPTSGEGEAAARPPWLDRMRRYGWPPGYLMKLMGRQTLKMVGSGAAGGNDHTGAGEGQYQKKENKEESKVTEEREENEEKDKGKEDSTKPTTTPTTTSNTNARTFLTSAGPIQHIATNTTLLDISKPTVNNLPPLQFHLNATLVVVQDVNQVDRRVEQLKQFIEDDAKQGRNGPNGVKVLGFDTETKPKFTKGNWSNAVALIQLATTTHAMLFRVCAYPNSQIPSSLIDLLADPSILKVGVGVSSDVKAIRTRNPDFTDSGSFFDLMLPFKKIYPRLKRLGLRNLSASVLGLKLSKSAQKKNWEGPMSTNMMNYAANDAIVGMVLFRGLIGLHPLSQGEEVLPAGVRRDVLEVSNEDNTEQLMAFPLYMWAPQHPEINAMFGHLYRPPTVPALTSSTSSTSSTTSSLKTLASWPSPVE